MTQPLAGLGTAEDRAAEARSAQAEEPDDDAPTATASAPSLAGFADLPREIRLQILGNCDWTSLYRVGATCRSNRALVDLLVRCPYFHTLLEERPVILTTEYDSEEAQRRACENWASSLAKELGGHGRPDICLLFISCTMQANLPGMLRALRVALPACCAVAGVLAPGLVGCTSAEAEPGRELDPGEEGAEVVALSVALIHLPPGTHVTAAYAKHGLERLPARGDAAPRPLAGELPPAGALPPAAARRAWLVLSDTHSFIPSVLSSINQQYPLDVVVGCMGGYMDHSAALLVGLPGRGPDAELGAALTSGTLCITLCGPHVAAESAVARGMRRISPRYMVQAATPNVDLSPVGRATLVQALQHCMQLRSKVKGTAWVPTTPGMTPTAALVQALQDQGPRVPPRAPLFLGVCPRPAPDEAEDWGRMTMLQMHDPNNLMRTSGFVSVQYAVSHGMLASYFTPCPIAARRHLAERVAAAAVRLEGAHGVEGAHGDADDAATERVPISATKTQQGEELFHLLTNDPGPVYGALWFPCVAKGFKSYGERNVEADILNDALPSIPQCGCFCNGELGPAPDDELAPAASPAVDLQGYSTAVCLLRMTAPPPPPDEWTH
eukprot:scaffold1.g5547.t1